MNELINLSSLISHVSVRGCSFVTRKVAFWSQFHPLLHKHSNIPVGVSALREPQLTFAAPWAAPGVGISEGQESQREIPLPHSERHLCQNKVWEAVLAPCPGWSQIHPNTQGWPLSRAFQSVRRLLLILMGFMPFAMSMLHGMKCPFSALVLLRLGDCDAFS